MTDHPKVTGLFVPYSETTNLQMQRRFHCPVQHEGLVVTSVEGHEALNLNVSKFLETKFLETFLTTTDPVPSHVCKEAETCEGLCLKERRSGLFIFQLRSCILSVTLACEQNNLSCYFTGVTFDITVIATSKAQLYPTSSHSLIFNFSH